MNPAIEPKMASLTSSLGLDLKKDYLTEIDLGKIKVKK